MSRTASKHDLHIDDVDVAILRVLQDRASRHGRTAAEEAKAILTDALRTNRDDTWTAVDAIYQRLAASGRNFSDSADLLREDRDR